MKEQAAADGDLAARAQEILKRQVARLRTARAGGTGGAPAPEELKEQVQQLQVELDARNAKVGERERKIAELAQQADALRGEVDKALALLSESGKPDVRAFAEDLKARDARYAELQTVHAQNVETLEGLRQNLGRLQNELAQAQADAEVKTRALAKQDEEIRGLRAEVQKGREQSVTEQEHVFDKADGRLKRAVKAQADLEKQVAALEAQLSDQQTRAADKDRAVAGVRQALRDHEILAREAGHLRVSNAEQAEALNRQKRDLRDVVRMAAEQKQELARKATALAARDTELENARADLEAARRKLGEDEKALDAMAENGRLKTAFAETAQQQMRRMTNDLAQARQEQARQAGSLAALTQRLQQATDEAAGLRSAAAQKDALLFTREEQIKIMRATQQRQDQALAKLKAEMAAVKAAAERDAAEREAAEREAAPKIGPEKAPSSPEPAEVRTQRATHGRMAAEYVGTGKYREAEKEYLLLLEADPDDADAHFNLGVLYDDKLKNTAAAALHYREYLRLRPNAHDSAEVRRWIVEAEDR